VSFLACGVVAAAEGVCGVVRYLNVVEARALMVQTLRWREQFGVADAMREVFPQEVFGLLGHLYGHDKAGRPVG
jgi:phosphatidylinositol transfer protein SFH5